jgi:hypothetical protein
MAEVRGSLHDDFHKTVLTKNELYLSSPRDFNDPFDCRIPPNLFLLSEKERNDYALELMISHYPEAIERGIDLNKAVPQFLTKMTNLESAQEELEELEFNALDEYFGVLSLSCRWNSVLMWSHYSNCHRGFCIGFKEEEIRNSITHKAVGMRLVDYDTEFPKIKPKVVKSPRDPYILEKRFTQMAVKSLEWKYEEEYRIFYNFFPKKPDTSDRILKFKDNAIVEVIFGMNMSDPDRKKIESICKSKGIKTYQAKKIKFKFDIVKDPLK